MIRNRKLETRRVRAGDLIPNPLNWRQHPDAQRRTVQAVLEDVGDIDYLKVVATPEGLMLVDGHLRSGIMADQEVDVVVLDLDEAEQKLILATFDPLAGMAYRDDDVFLDLASQVETERAEIAALLEAVANDERRPLYEPEIEQEETLDIDEAMEQAEADDYEPRTKRGQVWQLGDHRLMCGEAVEDHAAFLDGCHVNLVLTDPPYGINIVKHGQVHQDGGAGAGVVPNRQYMPVHGDDKTFDPTWLTMAGDNQIIFGGGYFSDKLPSGTCWLCWDKGVEADWSFSGFELAWTSFEGHYRMYRHMWSGMIRKGSRRDELKDRVHPTQKPVGLFADILTTFTSEGDLVCDPYLGSGTTLIAAEKLRRRCYAMEIEPRYCDVAIRRWEDFTGQKAKLQKGKPNVR